jgi:hypothetical protein
MHLNTPSGGVNPWLCTTLFAWPRLSNPSFRARHFI